MSEPFASAATTTLNVRCDDFAKVYVDGILVGGTKSLQKVWTGKISNDAHLIAVACENVGGPGGLLVSMEDFLVSNTKWKCSRTAEKRRDWYKLDFNDSTWNSSYKIADNDGSIWQVEPFWKQVDFPVSAQWIWADEQWERLPANSLRETIYCRRKTGKDGLSWNPLN